MNILLLLLIGLIWGSQFVLIDYALEAYPPSQLALIRCISAAIFLVMICVVLKQKGISRSWVDRSKVLMIGVLEVVIPFTLLMWAQQYVSGSMASILMGTIPLFTLIIVVLARLERANNLKIIAIVIGFIGLLVLFVPNLIDMSLSENIGAKIAILLGALSFATALVLIRSMPNERPFVLSRDAFVVGSLVLLFIDLIFGRVSTFMAAPSYMFAAIALGMICSGLVYVLYMVLIQRASATYASFSNYLVPVFGSILGVTIMGDHFSWYMAIACALVIIAVAIEPTVQAMVRRGRSEEIH